MKTRSLDSLRELLGRCAPGCLLVASSLATVAPALAQTPGEDPFAAEPTPAAEDASAAATDDAEATPEAPETGADVAEPETPAPDAEEPSTYEAPAEPQPAEPSAEAIDASAEASLDTSTPSTLAAPEAEPAAERPAPPAHKPLPLALELLPLTAYPNDPVNGIPGGSLQLVLNRQQWPYMPAYEGGPALRVGISGSAWIDSNFRSVKPGSENESIQTEYRQQGRFKLRVNPVYNLANDWFVQSSMEFVANADQNHTVTNYVDVDEAWIKLGKWKLFDIQVGRMQGYEIYHFGMGLDLNTFERAGAVSSQKSPVQPYGLTDLWDRGISTGAVAAHLYLPKWLRLELMGRMGLSGTGNDLGFRPSGVVDLGWLKLKAGAELRSRQSIFNDSEARTTTKGMSSSLHFVFDPWVEFGGGIGHRLEDSFDQDGGFRAGASTTTTTAGGFVNVRPYFEDWMIGLGYHHTYQENFNFDAFGFPENSTHDQMYGALQYLLWDRLYIKYVLAYSNGHIEDRNDSDRDDDGFNNQSISHRLRLMMLF